MTDAANQAVTDYRSKQQFNPINRYLHSIRYGELRRFLATVLTKDDPSIFEIGCGYGQSIDVIRSALGGRSFKYYGADLGTSYIEHAKSHHGSSDVRFECRDARDMAAESFRPPEPPDCIIALEVFEHIRETDVPKVVEWLVRMDAPALITVPNETGPAILIKNLGSAAMGYVRHRDYRLKDTLNAAFGRMERLPPHGRSHIGFDWRWLLSVLKQRYRVDVRTSPYPFVPRSLSPSIFFYCWPRR